MINQYKTMMVCGKSPLSKQIIEIKENYKKATLFKRKFGKESNTIFVMKIYGLLFIELFHVYLDKTGYKSAK